MSSSARTGRRMAANKFATLLHRSSHRVVLLLVYTLLEWILIALLLLNGLFSYLISRFAAYFGLAPPCIFCSRIDHLLDGGNRGNSVVSAFRGSLICDVHATEVSRLGYCSSHRSLAEAGDMCDGCSSSLPSPSSRGGQQTLAILSMVEKEEAARCSCCCVELDGKGFFSPHLFFKPSWGVLGYTHKEKSADDKIAEADTDDEGDKGEIVEEKARFLDGAMVFPLVSIDELLLGEPPAENGIDDDVGEERAAESVLEGMDTNDASSLSPDAAVPVEQLDDALCKSKEVDESIEILNQGRGIVLDDEGECPVPVEVIDSITLSLLGDYLNREEHDNDHDQQSVETEEIVADKGILCLVDDVEVNEAVVDAPAAEEMASFQESSYVVLSAEEQEADSFDVQQAASIIQDDENETYEAESPMVKLEDAEVKEAVIDTPVTEETGSVPESSSSVVVFADEEREEDSCDVRRADIILQDDTCEAESFMVELEINQGTVDKAMDGEANCEVSIGSEICDEEQVDHGVLHNDLPPLIDLLDESSENLNVVSYETQDAQSVSILEVEQGHMVDGGLDRSLPTSPKHNEIEEERPPEMPSYMESSHKRFLFERREFGAESLDGSVASEADVSDILTVDQLKMALKAERKALGALYAELEEERSASAIAANQTMAMITRLQEEKAAMQMEALQYQRMMEEQSEYDQEALHLLNELMNKREKEKQDLEKELEIYRKKVLLYESKERRRLKAAKVTGRSETSCASSSAEDSDDLSLELNDSDENLHVPKESNQNTPADAVLASRQETAQNLVTVDESLADFEEERLHIIEQLKVLEEKLFTLDEGEHSPLCLDLAGHFQEENGLGHHGDYDLHNSEANANESSFIEDHQSKIKHQKDMDSVGFRGKRLLPLFDAVGMENEDNFHEETEAMFFSPGPLPNLSNEQKKLAIAEEVDNVYERLQALEADSEFLKHCLNSMKRGEKGMDLLQEILQHLRDLRSVEHRVRNAGDAAIASLSA